RVSPQRIGKGVEPKQYHQAVPLHSSSVRAPSPYQSRRSRSQTVCGSERTCSKEGRRGPTTRGRPSVWGAQRSWLVEDGIEAHRRNQGDLLASTVQAELQDAVGLVS